MIVQIWHPVLGSGSKKTPCLGIEGQKVYPDQRHVSIWHIYGITPPPGFNCSERLLESHHFFLVPVVAACSQLLLKSVSKLFENVEWSNSLLRHFKIQTLLKINCSMAAISAFGVTQHNQIFSLFFKNRIQCIALYQLHNSQALLNLRRGCYKI